jgi:hypothetical protein
MKPPEEFKKYRKQVQAVNSLVKQWIQEQSELQLSGLEKKEAVGVTTERRRMKDLQKLKTMGGPFVNPKEVDDFINDDTISTQKKEDRLYTEIRYARDTTLSLPKASDLFRLKEKIKNQYKNLSVVTYASNLKVYLGIMRCFYGLILMTRLTA